MNITATKVTQDANIELTQSGSISIDKISGAASISTNSGNIFINEAISSLSLTTQTGSITIEKANTQVSLTLNNGYAKINFNEEAGSYSTNNNSRILNARINNGQLDATGVEHIGEVIQNSAASGGIKISGNGSANIKMNAVYGKNSISSENGNIRVVVNKNAIYELKTQTTTGNVRVNLTQISEYNGYTTKTLRTTNVNCNSSLDKLNISTTAGSLIVLDTNFA